MTPPRHTLRSFWRRRSITVAAAEIDPADMGTCYGLEMSLDLPRPTAEPAAAADAAPWWERAGARKAFGA